jgi:hypothetical protein
VQKLFGPIAIFCGWLSIPIGATAGLLTSQFFGLGRVEGTNPPMDVYFVSGIAVFWVYTLAAIVSAVPLVRATVARDPRRSLQLTAAVMWIVGASMLASQLGRAFGLPVLVGGACLWFGAETVYQGAASIGLNGALPIAPPTIGASGDQPAGEPAATDLGAVADVAPGAPSFEAESGSFRPLELDSDAFAPSNETAPSLESPEQTRGSGQPETTTRVCPWCSAAILVSGGTCPACGATLDNAANDQVSIPGLTEVPASLRKYAEDTRRGKKKQTLLQMMFSEAPIPTAIDAPDPSDAAALRPPSATVKAEMLRIEYELAVAQLASSAAGAAPVEPPLTESGAAPETAPTPEEGAPAGSGIVPRPPTESETAPAPGPEPDPRA